MEPLGESPEQDSHPYDKLVHRGRNPLTRTDLDLLLDSNCPGYDDALPELVPKIVIFKLSRQ